MANLPVTAAGRIALTTVAPGAGDNPWNGLNVSSGGNARAVAATPTQFQNGLGFNTSGQLCYVDATAGPPANSVVCNGILMSPTGQLCTSTGAIAYTQNGIPTVANGAVAATIV